MMIILLLLVTSHTHDEPGLASTQQLKFSKGTQTDCNFKGTDTPTKKKLRKKLGNYRLKVHRLKRKLIRPTKLIKSAKSSEKLKMEAISDAISEFVSGPKHDLIMSQIRNSKKHVKARRWTYKDKSIALSLMHSSPKTYRLLRSILDLPSPFTLKKIMHNIKVYPGFNENILKGLEMKLSNTNETEKLVSICIDEMAIKEGVTYDSGRDLIEGFTEGLERTNHLCNHAIVFMVRGITTKWKQPIGYFLTSGPMSGNEMKTLLLQCVDELKSIGLTPVVTILDQGSNNRNMVEKHLCVTSDKPYFVHDGTKIFIMYDPPHLIKNVRNNFKKHGFTIDKDLISWKHVEEFFHADSSKPIRLAPRLTKTHLDLPPFTPMRVKLATQVLSHSVASGMAFLAQWGIIPDEAKHTSDFIEQMDQLFNCFNSMTLTSKSYMRHAISSSSGHVEHLKQKLTWLKKVKSNSKRVPPCLSGWEMTINAVLMLWEMIHSDYGVKFLLTNRLNQDCVENLFSIIRAKGAQRDNPDASQFRAALRQAMVDTVMVPIKTSNCEADVDKFICNLDNFKNAKPAAIQNSSTTSIYDELPFNVKSILSVCKLPETNEGLSNQETNVLAYISGYIIKKLQLKICDGCFQKIVSPINEDDPNHQFIAKKSYVNLKAPSKMLLGIVELLELKYRKVIDMYFHSSSVKAALIQNLSTVEKLNSLHCQTCCAHKLVLHLMLNIRLHHTIRQANRNLKANKDRKNRKTLKFSHL